jgi:hypothetical protein
VPETRHSRADPYRDAIGHDTLESSRGVRYAAVLSGRRLSSDALARGEEHPLMPTILGRLLCLLGIHDFRILEVTYGFAPGSDVQRLECRRCGRITTTSG